MLTGRTPFAGGITVVIGQILAAPAPPVKEFRPDVDSRLDAICRKAMAKEPTERFASMAELADALDQYLKAPPSAVVRSLSDDSAVTSPPTPALKNGNWWQDVVVPGGSQAKGAADGKGRIADASVVIRAVPSPSPAWPGWPGLQTASLFRKKWQLLAGAGVGLLLTGLLVLWAVGVFKVKTPDGILVVQVNEPNAEVYVDGARMTVSWNDGETKAEIHVKPGSRKVEVKKDGFTVDSEELTFKDGDRKFSRPG